MSRGTRPFGATYPAIAQALLKSASPQLRNMASMGGNLMQRTRCPYFRAEVDLPCNKRRPGSGCAALEGEDRTLAIFGWSEHCIATHPSDVAVALAALDARVRRRRAQQADAQCRSRTFTACRATRRSARRCSSPASSSPRIDVPASPMARRSHYLKVRERASYEFALVSAAVALDLDGGMIREARIALGGVAPKPWRLPEAEAALHWHSHRSAGGSAARPRARLRRSQAAPAQRLQGRARQARGRARTPDRRRHRMTHHRTTHQPARRPRQGHGRGALYGRYADGGVAYAVLVPATIPSGTIIAIDAAAAAPAPGVLSLHASQHAELQRVSMPAGQAFLPLQDDRIVYEGQPVALVVADTLRMQPKPQRRCTLPTARSPSRTDFRAQLERGHPSQLVLRPDSRTGDAAQPGFGAGQTRAHLPHRRPASQCDGAIGHDRALAADGSLLVHDAMQGVVS